MKIQNPYLMDLESVWIDQNPRRTKQKLYRHVSINVWKRLVYTCIRYWRFLSLSGLEKMDWFLGLRSKREHPCTRKSSPLKWERGSHKWEGGAQKWDRSLYRWEEVTYPSSNPDRTPGNQVITNGPYHSAKLELTVFTTRIRIDLGTLDLP